MTRYIRPSSKRLCRRQSPALESTDWISELPTEIKQHIISFLPDKDAVRTMVLSKSWKLLGDLRPILVFQEDYYPGRNQFSSFLNNSLQIFSRKGVLVEELNLSVCLYPAKGTINAVSRWIRFAVKTNLKALTLEVHCYQSTERSKCSKLLDALALSSSGTALTMLTLSGFELAATTPRRSWKLPSLKSLWLVRAILNPAAVQDLVSSCPSLEQLQLSQVNIEEMQTRRLEFSGVGNLKRVKVELSYSFLKISIAGATSLESFTCTGSKFQHGGPLASIELGGCEASLKELRVSSINLSKECIESEVSKFRSLKVLALEDIDITGQLKLKISGSELKELFLKNLGSLASEPEICAPNLRKLELVGYLVDQLLISNSLQSVNLEYFFTKDTNKYYLYDKLQYLFYKIQHINNVVVCFVFPEPKIAIVHEGHSDDLLDTLCDIYDSMSHIGVIVSSDRNWDQLLFRDYELNRIYIASSLENNNNQLSEYLVKELTSAKRNRREFCIKRYVESIEIETEEDKPRFGDEVDSQHALLQVYSGSPFRLTRFALQWSGYNNYIQPH